MSEAKIKALKGLLTSFPQSAPDREGFLKVMLAVLDDVSDEAVRATAIRYAKGLVAKQSKTFAPTPAEFSSECREYDKLEQLKNRPRIEPPAHVKRGSYFERQEAVRSQYAGFKILHENITALDYRKLAARKDLPNPHFYVAQLGTIYGGLHPKLAGQAKAPRPYSEVAE